MFDGGGFMQSSNSGENPESQSVYTGDRVASARSLMIRQVLDAGEPNPESGIHIDNAPVDRVKLAGIVQDVSIRQTSLAITLFDVTGLMTVTLFLNQEDEPPQIETHRYAMIFGTLRALNNKIAFTASNVDQKIDADYILNHEMKALREHLHYTGRRPFGTKGPSNTSVKPTDKSVEAILNKDQELRNKIMEIMPTTEPGLPLDAIAATLGLDEETVTIVIQGLEEKSEIWMPEEGCYVASISGN